MLTIPLIPKDPQANDFTCQDGEIEFICIISGSRLQTLPDGQVQASGLSQPVSFPSITLTPEASYPSANIRIPLQEGDAEKARLLLSGEISRVDPASAERISGTMLEKSADTLLSLSNDFRKQGLFILPFRVYTLTISPDGKIAYPSPQAIALPADFPPHPEITASSITSDCLTLTLRFPLMPHRLSVSVPANISEGYSLRTFISYPLYIPDPKEIKGSIGSVRSAVGGNATGIRFAFLSLSAIKSSVAAPEKYYELVGNQRTGYRISSKAAVTPDYSVYYSLFGFTPEFPKSSIIVPGQGIALDTDPLDWIADWKKSGSGYLPDALPYIYTNQPNSGDGSGTIIFPEGIDKERIIAFSQNLGANYMLLTRPLAFASNQKSRHGMSQVAVRSLHIQGLPDACCHAILYGSDDCRHWHPMRSFNPHNRHIILSPPRLWHRLLILSSQPLPHLSLIINHDSVKAQSPE
ncbi:MAG: hypothetical protein K2G13_07190 [Muribaculaceae bacterium]|nr:hypothetical protein [Muribaculaceae bacterium]